MIRDIRYIVTVNNTTGRIISILYPQATLPTQGVSEDGSERVVYVTDANLPLDCHNLQYFMDEHWFDLSDLVFIHIGKAPNKYAEWQLSTSSWTWDADALLQDIRIARAGKLQACDWTQVADSALSEEKKAEFRVYRQALRDLPLSVGNPESIAAVSWPTVPSLS